MSRATPSSMLASVAPLLERARSGGELPAPEMTREAFAAAYRRTAPGLRAFVRRSLGAAGRDHVEDVVQESYLRLLRSGFESGDPRVERGYLHRIATNLVRDRYRRRRPEGELVSDPEAPRSRSGVRGDVSRLFRRLSLKDRQILWLAHVEQHSHREVAEVLGVREASVRVLLLRARRRLAVLLEAEGIGPEVLT